MIVVKSNIVEKADDFLSELERLMEAGVHRALVKTAIVGETRVKGIVEREAYDTGRFLRSVTSTISKGANDLKLVLGTNLDYAVDIEFGRKPGKWPNLDDIVKWCGRKLRAKGVNTRVNVTYDELKALARTGRKKPTAQQEAYRTHLSFVFLVGRKIATRGIRQKLIFKRIEPGLLAYFRTLVERELDAI